MWRSRHCWRGGGQPSSSAGPPPPPPPPPPPSPPRCLLRTGFLQQDSSQPQAARQAKREERKSTATQRRSQPSTMGGGATTCDGLSQMPNVNPRPARATSDGVLECRCCSCVLTTVRRASDARPPPPSPTHPTPPTRTLHTQSPAPPRRSARPSPGHRPPAPPRTSSMRLPCLRRRGGRWSWRRSECGGVWCEGVGDWCGWVRGCMDAHRPACPPSAPACAPCSPALPCRRLAPPPTPPPAPPLTHAGARPAPPHPSCQGSGGVCARRRGWTRLRMRLRMSCWDCASWGSCAHVIPEQQSCEARACVVVGGGDGGGCDLCGCGEGWAGPGGCGLRRVRRGGKRGLPLALGGGGRWGEAGTHRALPLALLSAPTPSCLCSESHSERTHVRCSAGCSLYWHQPCWRKAEGACLACARAVRCLPAQAGGLAACRSAAVKHHVCPPTPPNPPPRTRAHTLAVRRFDEVVIGKDFKWGKQKDDVADMPCLKPGCPGVVVFAGGWVGGWMGLCGCAGVGWRVEHPRLPRSLTSRPLSLTPLPAQRAPTATPT